MSVANEQNSEMLDEYDFSNGIRGKYVERLKDSDHFVLLEPDVAEVFHDSESVNRALRGLLPIIRETADRTSRQ